MSCSFRDLPVSTASKKTKEAIELLNQRNGMMFSQESRQRGTAPTFVPRPTDIFVATPPKTGTTWTMQICHALRTKGNSDFDEITAVVPWDVAALDCGQDLDADQVANPRIFKSHCTYESIAKGAKYIYVARNPQAVIMSFYQFIIPYYQLSLSDIPFRDFVNDFFLKNGSNYGSIFTHFVGWWQRREEKDVLFLFFEDLVEDLPTCVEKIGKFMGIEVDEELKKVVCEVSSYGYMRENAQQFDDHFVRNMAMKRIGLPIEEKFAVGKVREGGGKTKYAIGEEVEAILQRCWEEEVMPTTKYKNYDEFRKDLSILKK
mmetsp:Transcript_7545/g.11364  ORF Transcript_7545/g.11364 Transcript_7545/m.11364 type:complete len:317 (-) Transcript_7545:9-959(-)